MNWMTQCAVVIPCLNEGANIGQVVNTARRLVNTIFVVDDGSQDGTGAIAKRAGAEVLRHPVPRGKGAALQTGWAHARERGFRWTLMMDGDGQHSVEDIPKFFESAERTGAALVVGNRMEKPEGMPPVRRLVNRWMSQRISSLAKMRLPDSQCGFRLMNLDTRVDLSVNAGHFEIESDMLLAVARRGDPIAFVPIAVIYKDEQSKIHPVRDTVRWVRWWWRAGSVGEKALTPASSCRTAEGEVVPAWEGNRVG
ncbi:MAG TPA: glycosyltransferase family 2 protein [Verrucomicrobiae bacterium]|nr:glycosyltransferase family 2 protein [Verrucomicrobiae bacterium]